jgi:hypothetical protein
MEGKKLMKKVLTFVLMVGSALAQTAARDSEMVTVPKSALSEQQLVELEAKGIEQKAQAYGKWVGVGKEVGVAIDSSLAAISNRTNEFANTKVGTVAMWVVVFKVLGEDVFGFVFSLILIFFGLPTLIWSYRRTVLGQNVLVKISYDEKGKKIKEYKYIEPRRQVDGYALLHGVGGIILLIVPAIIAFA